MEKRGQSHIEFILSFLIFIAAVSFAVYFFSPAYKTTIADSTLTYTDNTVKDKLKTELDTYYIKTDSNSDFSTLGLDLGGKNMEVEDYETGNRLGFGTSDGGICIQNNRAAIVALYVSSDINGGGAINCQEAGQGTISSVIKDDVISEKKAREMVSMYDSNYDGLKNELSIPASRDFYFGIIFSTADRIEPTKKSAPRGVNVYSKSESLEVIRVDGERKFGEVYVQIW